MQRLILSGLFLFLFTSVVASAADAIPAAKVVRLNDHVYALLGPVDLPNAGNHGYMVNSAVIIGKAGVVLVDTGFSRAIGEHIKKTIRSITPKPVTVVINTHDHGDHTLGNIAFKGATIISSEKCKEVMGKTGYEWIGLLESMTGQTFPDTKPLVASKGYAPGMHRHVKLEGIDFSLWVPPGSHTNNDLVVYLPKDKILISGDILESEIAPNFRDANVKNWIGTLAKIQTMPISKIIPGHGPIMSMADAGKFQDRMQKLYAGVEAGYKKGLTDSEIRKSLDLSAWKKLKHFDDFMGTNINRTYLEVEAANF